MPISVSALRDHCRIVGDDFDTQLTRAWYAAAYDIERRTGLLLRPCEVRVSLRGGSALQGFVLPVGPVKRWSVDVKNNDNFLVDANGDYIVDEDYNRIIVTPGTEVSNDAWHLDINCPEPTICIDDISQFEETKDYVLTYSAGMSSIPNDLTVAVLELTAHHFENREATAPIMLHAVPNSVWSIVANYGRGKV